MKKRNIILTGFMATGKTTVGKRLAAQLGYRFVDTDRLIEARSGMTVPEIFERRGEAAFRALEAEVARELGARRGLVIATGGRLMLDAANAAALGRQGRVFCLVASAEEISARVAADPGVARPMLAGPDLMARLLALIREREGGYRQFAQIDTTGKTPAQVTAELLAIIRAAPACAPPA
ncbi:MAG TPA: shikimate kinase [Desulfobacterales bacterium]|nr:shikimate kinase [Desulfobacterales bacterium]